MGEENNLTCSVCGFSTIQMGPCQVCGSDIKKSHANNMETNSNQPIVLKYGINFSPNASKYEKILYGLNFAPDN